jgi:hypothetical protein
LYSESEVFQTGAIRHAFILALLGFLAGCAGPRLGLVNYQAEVKSIFRDWVKSREALDRDRPVSPSLTSREKAEWYGKRNVQFGEELCALADRFQALRPPKRLEGANKLQDRTLRELGDLFTRYGKALAREDKGQILVLEKKLNASAKDWGTASDALVKPLGLDPKILVWNHVFAP